MKKAILIITDGIGYSPKTKFNSFYHAKTPTYDNLFQKYKYGMIKTYGLSVGLPEGQMGNSEVGHITIGSGRVLFQDLVRISQAIKNGQIETLKPIQNIIQQNQTVHLAGLLSDGGVHSHIEHLIGLIKIFLKHNKKVVVHAITDGRDVSPTSSVKYFETLFKIFKNDFENDKVQIGSVAGRFWTIDRDKRWERVEKGFRAMVEAIPKTDLTPIEYIQQQYQNDETDEFITPISFGNYSGFKNGDALLFFNFRSDRAREIIQAIGEKDFNNFKRDFLDINIVTMTQYHEDFNYPILFEKIIPKNGLAETISKNGGKQLHVAETEKYAHVTFFFNGGIEKSFPNEKRILIDSPKVKTYDLKPEMSAEAVTDEVLKGIDENFDFIVVNFANGDMVGHTGNFEAAIQAVETVDKSLGKIISKAQKNDYSIVLTSDHGNCEEMKDENGNILTNHTVGDVWCFVIDDNISEVKNGGLDNIAPTILKLMELDIPKEMSKPLI